jgi:hypothetical protein
VPTLSEPSAEIPYLEWARVRLNIVKVQTLSNRCAEIPYLEWARVRLNTVKILAFIYLKPKIFRTVHLNIRGFI